MLVTTLNKIREHSPCEEGWRKLLDHLGKTKADDDVVAIETIIDSNGLDDALWCLRAVEQTSEVQRAERLFAVWCARQVQHLMTDQRSISALDVAERYANGTATDEELEAARAAACDAARGAARAAACDAARAAARGAACDAACDAARAAARGAARDAAWVAAWAAARDAQKDKFRLICKAGKWVD